MRGDGNGTRRAKRPAAADSEAASTGSAIRQAFLRHIDEQQLWAGFAPGAARASAATPKDKPRGRTKR